MKQGMDNKHHGENFMQTDFGRYAPRNQWFQKHDGSWTVSDEEAVEQMMETYAPGNAEDKTSKETSTSISRATLDTIESDVNSIITC